LTGLKIKLQTKVIALRRNLISRASLAFERMIGPSHDAATTWPVAIGLPRFHVCVPQAGEVEVR
jgi:hypothetical protein